MEKTYKVICIDNEIAKEIELISSKDRAKIRRHYNTFYKRHDRNYYDSIIRIDKNTYETKKGSRVLTYKLVEC